MNRINRATLLEILLRVAPGLSSRDFIEQSSCFAFTGGWVATFNDEICCRTKTGFDADFVGAVHAQSLLRVLENMSEDEVDLNATAKELVVIGKRKKAGIRMESEIILPVEQVEPPESWTPIPEDFGVALKTVAAAAGTNDEEFMTVCIHITPEFMEACDRRQATRYTLATGVSRPFLVRAKSIIHVADRAMLKIGETDNWVHLRNKDLFFSCRRHIDAYPDNVGKMLSFRGEPAVLPRGADEAAKLGSVFSGEDKNNDRVTVNLSNGRMLVRGEGTRGWSTADLEMNYRGDPVSFRIDPGLLCELVKRHTECEIGPGKLVVTGERWKYLTVLGRVEESKPASEPAVVPDAVPKKRRRDDDDDTGND